MHRPIPTLVAVLIPVLFAAELRADRPQRLELVSIRAAAAPPARVYGIVRDQSGHTVAGVSVVAMGATVAEASSDRVGRFVLTLPPGSYLLRATRDGYLSTVREPIRVSMGAPLERNLTLVRQAEPIATAVSASAVTDPSDHAHTTLAWRLRQMRRVVLRDEAPAGVPWDVALLPEPTLDARSVFDRAVHSSMRAASAFFGKTDFDGQINWMTTGLLDVTGERPWSMMTGNVAYLAIGAPIAGHGSWMVRGAWSAGEPSSWVMLGEFTSSGDERHAIRAGVSYGALRPRGTDRVSQGLSVGEARTAGAVYLLDRWTVRPGLDVSYGLRVDAYDYLARSPVLSPRLGARVAVIGRTAVTLDGLQHAVAPGTAEFQPPAAAGLWLPPDRSFASIRSGGAIRAERVRELAVGVEHAFGAAGAERTVAFRRFRQTSHDQLVTLFGPGTAGASHYLTGALGDVEVTGWSARLTGALSPHVRGDITYAAGRVGWGSATRMSRRIQALAPSMVRGPRETLHDLSASVHAEIPATSTHVAMAYRVSSGFSATGAAGPVARARFAVEVRQPLPYQPLRGGSFDVLVGVRNLYRDLDDPGSFYDELLTVSPPLRFVGGIQVRF